MDNSINFNNSQVLKNPMNVLNSTQDKDKIKKYQANLNRHELENYINQLENEEKVVMLRQQDNIDQQENELFETQKINEAIKSKKLS